MNTKYTKRSRVATFGRVRFLGFSDFGNIFGENLDVISSRYQVSGIKDQGSWNREQGSGNREQETVN